MACQKCKQIGQEPQIIVYAKDGRWQRLETCKHHTRRNWRESPLRRKPTPFEARMVYSAEMDRFILLNYVPMKSQHSRTANKQMAKRFYELFNVPATLNALIGRRHRLLRMEKKPPHTERQVPSLPVLKFMQSEV